MDFRTDLALERQEILGEEVCDGVTKNKRCFGDVSVCEINITNENGVNALGKPLGKYVTVELPSFSYSAQLLDGRLYALVEEIRSMIPSEGAVLVAGLGNEDITADALGPMCISKIFATRHISSQLAESVGFKALRSVCCVSTGVLGKTGIEALEIIRGICENIKPTAVITVDALAARQLSRLGTTVQICDSGIFPGSGVGNRRSEISRATLGVPVISIGVPTVINGVTLAREILGDYDTELGNEYSDFTVSPKDADIICMRASKLIALGINCALQKEISREEMLSLMCD